MDAEIGFGLGGRAPISSSSAEFKYSGTQLSESEFGVDSLTRRSNSEVEPWSNLEVEL